MTALLVSLISFAAGAAASLIFANRRRWPTFIGAGGIILGCTCGIVPAVQVPLGASAQWLRMAWDLPYGSLFLRLDALSAFFLLPIFLISRLAALYGTEYLEAYRGKQPLGPPWFFLNVLTASMVVVVLAHNAVLFLMAWEAMALSSFFLVTFEDEKENTRQAGWIYLVASYIGTAFLLVLFVLLVRIEISRKFSMAPTISFQSISSSLDAPLIRSLFSTDSCAFLEKPETRRCCCPCLSHFSLILPGGFSGLRNRSAAVNCNCITESP